MTTHTIYVPANQFGRNVLAYIWEHVSCSMGDIRKVDNALTVALTLPEREISKVERILKRYDLM